MKNIKIGILVGSLRKESFNKKMANTLINLCPESMNCEIIEIGHLPLYNQDEDTNPAAEIKNFREKIKTCDAIIFFTPEYNRSVPGVLKNAIDVASRPYGQNAWAKKPVGVISVSPGALGGFGANHHLRQSLVFLDMPVMQQPEMYIGQAGKLFNEKGLLINDEVKSLLNNFIQSFELWINLILSGESSHFTYLKEQEIEVHTH